MLIRQFKETDLEQMFAVVNEAAQAYRRNNFTGVPAKAVG